MKKSVIGICISLLCVGTVVYANQQNNASSPVVSTVTKQTKDSKTDTNESKPKVSKHGETEKLEEVGNATNSEKQKKTEDVPKKSSSVKTEARSSAKAEPKSSVSSEGKKQTSSNQTKTSGTTKKDNSTVSSSSTGTSKEPVVEPAPTPESTRPSYACPGGVNQDVACDVILDQNHYFATYSSQAEADAAGVYYLNEVMYIGETEITNYSVQAVYRNDHSIAYYGLNLWSNGSLIQ